MPRPKKRWSNDDYPVLNLVDWVVGGVWLWEYLWSPLGRKSRKKLTKDKNIGDRYSKTNQFIIINYGGMYYIYIISQQIELVYEE